MSDAFNSHQLAFNSYSNQAIIYNDVAAIDDSVIANTVRGKNVVSVNARTPFYSFTRSTVKDQRQPPYKVTLADNSVVNDAMTNAVEGGPKYGYRTKDVANVRWLQQIFSNSWEARQTADGSGSFPGGWVRMLKIEGS